METLADDGLRHRDQHGRVGSRPDRDVLVGHLDAGPRRARVDGHDAGAALVGPAEILRVVGAERAVGGAPAPEDHEARVDVVGRLAPGELAVGCRTIRVAQGEDLGLVRQVRPQLGAAAEEVQEPLDGGAVVEDGRGPEGIADPPHLGRDLVEGVVPRDALVLARAPRAHAAHRVTQAVGVVDAVGGAEAAGAGGQRRHLEGPLARVGADAHDPPVLDVGVDHAAPAAVVPAGARDDLFARRARHARGLVDRLWTRLRVHQALS